MEPVRSRAAPGCDGAGIALCFFTAAVLPIFTAGIAGFRGNSGHSGELGVKPNFTPPRCASNHHIWGYFQTFAPRLYHFHPLLPSPHLCECPQPHSFFIQLLLTHSAPCSSASSISSHLSSSQVFLFVLLSLCYGFSSFLRLRSFLHPFFLLSSISAPVLDFFFSVVPVLSVLVFPGLMLLTCMSI